MTVLFSNITATLSHNILSSYFSDNNKDHGCRIRCNQLQKNVEWKNLNFKRTRVLCGAPFSAKNPASTPDLKKKIQSLFPACSEHKVEVGLILLAKQSSILDGSAYHTLSQTLPAGRRTPVNYI